MRAWSTSAPMCCLLLWREPFRLKAGYSARPQRCPLYPRKQTCAVQLGMSAWANSGHRLTAGSG
jgi:hypothetical protein